MWPNPQFSRDLVTFAEEILNGKLHFLCSDCINNKFSLENFSSKCEQIHRKFLQKILSGGWLYCNKKYVYIHLNKSYRAFKQDWKSWKKTRKSKHIKMKHQIKTEQKKFMWRLLCTEEVPFNYENLQPQPWIKQEI